VLLSYRPFRAECIRVLYLVACYVKLQKLDNDYIIGFNLGKICLLRNANLLPAIVRYSYALSGLYIGFYIYTGLHPVLLSCHPFRAEYIRVLYLVACYVKLQK
jgi:hypothetical protein